jgi:hypothetical protein
VRVETRRLEEARLVTLEDRIEADLAAGRGGELVPEPEPLVAEHPYPSLEPARSADRRRGVRLTAAVVLGVIAAGVALALALTVR